MTAGFPPRITFVTLACRDMERMTRFYRQFGWPSMSRSELRGVGGFSFRDPEGNIWDIAWVEGSRLDDRGGFTFP